MKNLPKSGCRLQRLVNGDVNDDVGNGDVYDDVDNGGAQILFLFFRLRRGVSIIFGLDNKKKTKSE